MGGELAKVDATEHGSSTTEETDQPRVAYSDWDGEFEPVWATWPL